MFNHKILVPIIALEGAISQKDIQRSNCLTLIVKDCNVYYSANKVTGALRKLIRDKNVIMTYYKNGDAEKDLHVEVCNLEVLNTIFYKQYVKTSTKILDKYVMFQPHFKSLNKISVPQKDVEGVRIS